MAIFGQNLSRRSGRRMRGVLMVMDGLLLFFILGLMMSTNFVVVPDDNDKARGTLVNVFVVASILCILYLMLSMVGAVFSIWGVTNGDLSVRRLFASMGNLNNAVNGFSFGLSL